MRGCFICTIGLFDSNFGAADSLAGKAAYAAGFVGNHTVAVGVHGKVTADAGAFARALGHAHLADDNLAGLNLLAAIYLNAKPLAGAVFDIFGGTACFNV